MIRQELGKPKFYAQFDLAQCKTELAELKEVLASTHFEKEREHILPFFYQRKHLCLAIGYSHPEMGFTDLCKTEYDLGKFSCDLALGNWEERKFLLVEFEDAKENSIFKSLANRRTSEWGTRLEHGVSQIIDWIYALQDMSQTNDYKDRFGYDYGKPAQFSYLLIIGRSDYLSQAEKERLTWRVKHMKICSETILIMTFDELVNKIEKFIKFIDMVK